jgi:asparagine synthase (glutamine-hydrolysing)
MCGIWASIGFPVDKRVIDIVAHRGPDGSGFERHFPPAGELVLAHRRLAVVDLSDAGLQPMRRDQAVIVLNGQIYNYVELRRELEALGQAFASDTDTEVLLAAYLHWGTSCLPRLRGMFAFAIYNQVAQQLFVARDRFGIKPLYLYETPAGIALASEIKQFTFVPGFTARLNPQRLYDFVSCGILDQDEQTFFAGVRQLPPGTCLEIDLSRPWQGNPAGARRWYSLPEPNILRMSVADAAERYRHLLDDAVRLHLRADVGVGSCLSGGLDSSSIVALASRRLGELRLRERFASITAVYDAPEVDERGFADALSKHVDVANYPVFPTAHGLEETLDKLVWHQDEPFGSTSLFAQWCVFERARQLGIKVMLDGQGADEQLGGYHFYFATYYRQLAQDRRFARMSRLYRARIADHGASPLEEVKLAAAGLMPWRFGATVHKWLNASADRSFSPEFLASVDRSLTPAERAVRRAGLPPPRRLGTMLSAQIRSTNLPMLLHFEDRNSMAHGIEARVPFLDHPLVEFAIALGDEHKIEQAETKVLLRRAMTGSLPERIAARKDKIGFATPERRWFRGDTRRLLLSEMGTLPRRLPGVFRVRRIEEITRAADNDETGLDGFGWRLACAAVWARVHNVAA